MKKYIILLLLCFFAAIISGILLVQHYYPDLEFKLLSCGSGLKNPCVALNQSGFATIFGIPIAAYGLFFYLFLLLSALIAGFSRGVYYNSLPALFLPLSVISLIIDVILLVILIIINQLCTLCISTYIINVLIFFTLFLWHRQSKKDGGPGFFHFYREILSSKDNPDRNAALASFALFAMLLLFSVVSSSLILKFKTLKPAVPAKKTESFKKFFYSLPREKLSLPKSMMTLGSVDARIKIVAFTDFLCRACYKFYKAEKYLFTRFRGKIKVSYYSFPLDKVCNQYAPRTVYSNSCINSRSFITASKTGMFGDFLIYHYQHFNEYFQNFKSGDVMSSLKAFIKENKIDENLFLSKMNSKVIADIQKKHIELAGRINIQATPTIFINGRRLEGIPPPELLEAVIINELKSD